MREKTCLCTKGGVSNWTGKDRFFLRRFRDQIRVPRISNRVPRIRENYHRVPKIRKNPVPRIGEIGSLQIQTEFLTFSLKKPGKSKENAKNSASGRHWWSVNV